MPKTKEISIISGKNTSLVGFGKLAKVEIAKVKEIMATYLAKIDERTDYNELRITLKQHQHSKSFLHELQTELFIHPGVCFSAKLTHKNLYRALALLMTKILRELDHKKKKNPRQQPIRKLSKKII